MTVCSEMEKLMEELHMFIYNNDTLIDRTIYNVTNKIGKIWEFFYE